MATMSDADPYGHDHVYLGAQHEENARRTRWVVMLTASMTVGEIVAGYVTGSMALLADGFHMATDTAALSIAAIAYSYARRHARSPAYSFGTGKVGDLAGFASALVLGLFAIGIAVESVMRLLTPGTVAFGEATVIAIVGLGVNLLSALLLGGGHHHGHGEHAGHDHGAYGHGGDNNLRSAYAHVLGDALTSVLAIGALLAGRYLGWVWMDPAMGIVGGVVIARWSLTLMRDTAATLLDRTDPRLVDAVRDRVQGVGDVRIADLHVWRIGPAAHAAIISVVAAEDVTGDMIRVRLAPVEGITHLTVEMRSAAADLN